MQHYGLQSRYFTLGLGLAVLFTLLAWGFSTAPRAARQQLYPAYASAVPVATQEVALPVTVTYSGKRITPPLFPACTDQPDYAQRKACADQAMLKFIYDNIRYPKEAKDAGATGMVVVRFPVDARGQTGMPVVVRSPHPALSIATLTVIQRMLRRHPLWEPGRENDQPVAAEYALPVQFKLE